MSIVPGRDVPAVPQAWVDAVNEAINDANHQDQCACDAWPNACVTGYKPGRWDIGVDLDVAAGALEPLIRERIAIDARKPKTATVARQLKAAGHKKTDRDEFGRRTPGFRVALNEQITPDGVAVLHMHGPDGEEAALASYAATLRGLGYDAQAQTLHAGSGLRGVYVKRPAKEDRRA